MIARGLPNYIIKKRVLGLDRGLGKKVRRQTSLVSAIKSYGKTVTRPFLIILIDGLHLALGN